MEDSAGIPPGGASGPRRSAPGSALEVMEELAAQRLGRATWPPRHGGQARQSSPAVSPLGTARACRRIRSPAGDPGLARRAWTVACTNSRGKRPDDLAATPVDPVRCLRWSRASGPSAITTDLLPVDQAFVLLPARPRATASNCTGRSPTAITCIATAPTRRPRRRLRGRQAATAQGQGPPRRILRRRGDLPRRPDRARCPARPRTAPTASP